MTADTYNPPESLSGFQSKAMIAAAAGAVLAVVGFAMTGLDRFYEAYLVAWVFWTGVALGSLALLMVQHLSGGAWGVVIRRILEAATRTLPVMAVLVPADPRRHGPPLSLDARRRGRRRSGDPRQGRLPQRPVLPRPLRALLRHLVVPGDRGSARWSAEQDRTGDPALAGKMARLSGGGLLVFGLTATFAVVDWTMSVNPHWFSTMWGLLYIVGQGLSALAFAIAVLVMLAKERPFDRVVNPSHLHDLGKLLFAFIMLWAYLSFSQFIIIYSANTAEEIPHYWVRAQNGWQWVGWALVALPLRAALRAAAVARHQARLAAG